MYPNELIENRSFCLHLENMCLSWKETHFNSGAGRWTRVTLSRGEAGQGLWAGKLLTSRIHRAA